MKSPIYAALLICGATLAPSNTFAQLKLIQRVEVPGASEKFDHFGVDLTHGRLFVTPESTNSLEVFDLRTGKHIRTIAGIGEGHSVLYREDLNRIYMADGGGDGKGPGAVQIIDGSSYALQKTVPLLPDADNFLYDPVTHHLYVTNGGKDAKLNYVMITEIATDTGEKVGEIKVSGDTVEAMALESGSRRMYANNSAMNTVEVIDRDQRKIVESWPLTLARTNVAMALDEPNHRLFLGCRDGHLLVMDTRTGKELQALAITKGKTDDMVFDPASKRIYVATAGAVDLYSQIDADHYTHLQTVETTPLAKTARLVPELNRYFVASPRQSGSKAEILIFEVR
jgi:DNA-binding beta-propeller fold protein YncE